MAARITLATVRWDGIVGATGYEIRVNGVAVATAGARARTSRVSVSDATTIEVVDLPERGLAQTLVLTQADGA